MTQDEAYKAWWHNEGSGIIPLPNEDMEEFAHRMTQIAWSNGAFKEREACAKLCDLAMLQNQEAINELEDIDINITWNENSMRDFGKDELNFARAIEAKLKEKNTLLKNNRRK